jgi:hypothetical protein
MRTSRATAAFQITKHDTSALLCFTTTSLIMLRSKVRGQNHKILMISRMRPDVLDRLLQEVCVGPVGHQPL